MTPKIRKLTLTAHIVSGVGWMGATAAFLALALAGLTSNDDRLTSSAYVAMKLIGWRVIVPLSLASLLTGLVQSLGTAWGLFRHYWVLLKFVLTVIATGLLLLHMNLATRLADNAAKSNMATADLHGLRLQIMADAAAAVLLLIVNTTLAAFKPRGMTRYGRRKQYEKRISVVANLYAPELSETGSAPQWVRVFGVTAFVLLVLFRIVVLHLSGGFGHHVH